MPVAVRPVRLGSGSMAAGAIGWDVGVVPVPDAADLNLIASVAYFAMRRSLGCCKPHQVDFNGHRVAGDRPAIEAQHSPG